jgi:hypothetical protein
MSTLQDQVRTEIKTAITGEEAVRLCGKGNFKGLLYDDLSGWTEARLAKFDGVVVLFTMHGPRAEGVGHFCALWKRDGVWHFHDPLGYGFDRVLHITHSEPHLTRILKGHKVDQNSTRFQRVAENVQDCALHTVTRLRKRELSHAEYGRWLKYRRLSPDEIVALLHATEYHL